MSRTRIYSDEERSERRRECNRRYYAKNHVAYEKSQIKYWINKLKKKGYTVIEPGGTEK